MERMEVAHYGWDFRLLGTAGRRRNAVHLYHHHRGCLQGRELHPSQASGSGQGGLQGSGGVREESCAFKHQSGSTQEGVLPPLDALRVKCYNITSSFRVISSYPFHKSPSLWSGGWQSELDHSLELDRSPCDRGLAVNPSVSSSKAATWAKQMHALPCRRASCCFGFPPVSPQAASSLLAYKPGFCHPALPYRCWALALTVLSPRMPAILDGDEAIRKWLDFAEVPTQEAVKLIQPTENIVFHPVSTFVNSVRNNTPECLAPIELGAKKVSAGGRLAGESLATVTSLSRDSSARLQEGQQQAASAGHACA